MPIVEKDSQVHEYPLATRGVNIHSSPVNLFPDEALLTQNCIWRGGIVKRGGQSKWSDTEVVASKKIGGLHRFYFGTSQQTLAAADTVVKHGSGTTWTNVLTGLTADTQVHIISWGGVQKAYISNGTDGSLWSWDGSSLVVLSGGNLPAKVIQTLPYQDRILAIDATNPGTLTWSAAFDDTPANWVPAATTGVKPDSNLYGMTYHSLNNSDSGYRASVLLAGTDGMYLFQATDMRTPATTGNYTIYPLATKIGCNAPRTMVWTPKGTLWLGVDRQVYLLPFGEVTPRPIGDKIRSSIGDVDGIEVIPAAQIQNACAVYHDGFYKLSFAASGGGTNTKQFWLDMERLQQDDNGYGPWYGPMTGQSISVFANMNGSGDTGQLLGGENTAATGGFVYELGILSILGDVTAAIPIEYKTFNNPLGTAYLNKAIHRMEMELLDINGTVSIDYHDITGSVKIGDSLNLIGGAVKWGDTNWGSFNWSAVAPKREVINISPAMQPRRLAMIIKFNSATEKFEMYAIRVEALEQEAVFD